jgi:NTE family protein
MRSLIISGGGSMGSYAGGITEYLTKDLNRVYNRYYGTSTGCLISSLLASNDFESLKKAYTDTNQDDIFSISPFKITSDKKGNTKTNINYINIIKNVILRRQSTLGDSSNLLRTIFKYFNEESFDKIKTIGKEVVTCVTNITQGEMELKSSNLYSYKDYCKYLYASCCVPPFMSIVKMDSNEYTDGGFMHYKLIQQAIDDGAEDIDIILLVPENNSYKIEKIRNVLHLILKFMIYLMHQNIDIENDLNKLKLKTQKEVSFNIYYTHKKLTNNALIFNSENMREWWQDGYNTAQNDYFKTYKMVKGGKAKLIYDGINNK